MKSSLLQLRWVAPVLCLGVFGAGCSSQVSSDYQGEPLLVVRGTIASSASKPAPSSKAALVWSTVGTDLGEHNPDGAFSASMRYYGEHGMIAAWTPVSPGFPATFELKVVAPPPADALHGYAPAVTCAACSGPPSKYHPLDDTKPREVAMGFVIALSSGADLGALKVSDIVGAALDVLVIYNAKDLPAGSPNAEVVTSYGAPTTAGYHMVKVKPPDAAGKQKYWKCYQANNCYEIVPHPQSSSPKSEWRKQEMADRYTECMQTADGPASCTLYEKKDPWEAIVDSEGCNESWSPLVAATPITCDGSALATLTTAPPNTSVTINLGARPWQVLTYRWSH